MAFNGRIKPNDPDLKFDFDTVDGRTVSGFVVEFTQQRVDLGMRSIQQLNDSVSTTWVEDGLWRETADGETGITSAAMSPAQFTSWSAQRQGEIAELVSDICGGSPTAADLAAMPAYQFSEFTRWMVGLITGDKRSKPVPAA